ncbi:MAG: hypothetical protein ACRD3A_10285 [Terriglobales bacterium]
MIQPPPLREPQKKFLLLDSNTTRRDLRARIMRKLGLEVDCAADTAQARVLWRAAFYHLLLVDLGNAPSTAARFCGEITAASPAQRVAFYVSKPPYLVSSPSKEADQPQDHDFGESGSKARTLFAGACDALPRRGSLLEAAWRISVTRALAGAIPGKALTPLARLRLSFSEAVRVSEISQAATA